MKWQDISEIVTGFVLKDKIDPGAINPMDIFPTYQPIISMKRDGKQMADIIATVSFNDVDVCLHAAERVNGNMQPLGYLKTLEVISSKAKAAMDLNELTKKLEKGEEVDVASLLYIAGRIESGYRDLTPMDQVEPTKVKFARTGYDPIDKHIGGVPKSCVTIIGGTPGIGKTTLGLQVMVSMTRLKENKKKKAALFSLEMTNGQMHQRIIELSDLTNEEKSRILVGDSAYTVHEIYAIATKAAAAHDLFAIVIDFADLMVEGEQSESVMGVIYRNLSMLSKKTGIPIILIAQLNRNTYDGGIPKIHHLRYSGLAEATSRLILLLFNPNSVVINIDKTKIPLPMNDGCAYIIVGKSNFGFKEGRPGGIQVEFDPEKGWGDKSLGYFKL